MGLVKGNLIFSFSGSGFAGICLEWGVRKIRCFVVNVYSPCNLEGKWKLWQDLMMSKRGFGGAIWCVMGDFNVVSNLDQRRGLHDIRGSSEIEEFNYFITEMDLVDVPLLGRKFTWYQADGTAMSRLDRFLLSEGWIQEMGVSSQWSLNMDVSDHCPIILKWANQD